MKKILILLFFIFNFAYAVPFVTDEMLKPQFWIKRTKNPDKVVMTFKEIEAFNKKMSFAVDIFNYPSSLSKDDLAKILATYPIPTEVRYDTNNQKIEPSFWRTIKEQINSEELLKSNPVRYGITVEKIRLRTFPTNQIVWEKENDLEFDTLQESDVDILTPLVVLHESEDKKWYLVQTREYLGWTLKEGIALARDLEMLKPLIEPKDFLIVTGSHISTGVIPVKLGEVYRSASFMMGTKIPLELSDLSVQRQNSQGNYIVKLPSRKEDGTLEIINAYISKQADVALGFLPYTRKTIITQIFKMLGERYTWGGTGEGRDCSRLILDTFRTVGINLPRNSYQQRSIGIEKFNFENNNDSESKKVAILKKLNPGTTFFKKGHVMFYLGSVNNRNYIIHAISKFYDPETKAKYSVMSSVVSDLSILEKGIDEIVWGREFVN